MSKRITLFKIFLLIVVVSVMSTFFVISISYAENEKMFVDAQEKEESNPNSCDFLVYLSDGITPATSGKHFIYQEGVSGGPGVIKILSEGNGLVITNKNPNVSANDVIYVENQKDVTSLTLRDVNISLKNSTNDAIYIKDSFSSYSFDLNIDGHCGIELNECDSCQCLLYETYGSGAKNFNLVGTPGSLLSIKTDTTSWGITSIANDSCKMTFTCGGNLYLDAISNYTLSVENSGEETGSTANLIIGDNANVKIQDTETGIQSEGNVTFQDNSYVNVAAENHGLTIERNKYVRQDYMSFQIIGNASADILSNVRDAVYLYCVETHINTSGYLNLLAPEGFGLYYYSNEDEVSSGSLDVYSGTVYAAGDSSSSSGNFGVFEAEKPFDYSVAEGYQVLGSSEMRASVEDLMLRAYIDEEPDYPDYYCAFVDDESNEPQIAKTVALIPPYDPPEPTPDVPGGNVQEVDTAAQTGDSALPIAVIAIVAVAAAGAAFGARKLRKN